MSTTPTFPRPLGARRACAVPGGVATRYRGHPANFDATAGVGLGQLCRAWHCFAAFVLVGARSVAHRQGTCTARVHLGAACRRQRLVPGQCLPRPGPDDRRGDGTRRAEMPNFTGGEAAAITKQGNPYIFRTSCVRCSGSTSGRCCAKSNPCCRPQPIAAASSGTRRGAGWGSEPQRRGLRRERRAPTRYSQR